MFDYVYHRAMNRHVMRLQNELADLRAKQNDPECSHKEFHRAKERAEQIQRQLEELL